MSWMGSNVEGDRHDDPRRSDGRRRPGTPEGVAKPGRDQQLTEQQ
jgi:hypothetical protein